MNTTNYMNILGAKIEEAQRQLSAEAQRYINNSGDDLYTSAMDLTFKIEQRYYCNDSDDSDYNILLNIMHLVDLMMEFMFDDNDDDFMEFVDDYIVIDED